jgi:UDP-N-acetylmuramoyl-L-alanyl-D-glutamate--2,6-diaminopimelate ligase
LNPPHDEVAAWRLNIMARWFIDRSPQTGSPSVNFRRLLAEPKFEGEPDPDGPDDPATSLRPATRRASAAISGRILEVRAHVGQGLGRGASASTIERSRAVAARLQVVVPDTGTEMARGSLCHTLAGDPSTRMQVVGVAGTRGKAATALLIRSILEAAGERVGWIGASGWSDGLTTRACGPRLPDAEGLSLMLAAMADRGCSAAVVELPAEALDRRKADGIRFAAGVVTTLDDPLSDDGEARAWRRRAAARLMKQVRPGGAAVVNADDRDASLLGAVNLDADRVSFGLGDDSGIAAVIERVDARGSRFRLIGLDGEATVTLSLVGRGHVEHALAAAGVGRALGLPLDAIVAGLESVARMPAPLEPVSEGQDFDIRVDAARTEGELLSALKTLRALGARRIHCVLGAEGDGDRGRRLGLARAAELGADCVILTADNPRFEDPDAILDDLLAGFRRPGRVRVMPDRREAIEAALAAAEPGDAVLLSGKGRSKVQILADGVIPFDDAAIAAEWLRANFPSDQRISA